MAAIAKQQIRECLHCKKPFDRRDTNQKYCNPECCKKADRERRAAQIKLGTGNTRHETGGGNHITNWMATAAATGAEDLAEVIFRMLLANDAFALVWLKLQAKVEQEKRKRVFSLASRPLQVDDD